MTALTKEGEGREAGGTGIKKSLRDEIKAKKGTWQHLEKRHCLWGEIYLCKNSLISEGWEQGRACKAGSWSPLSREKRRRRRKCSRNSRSVSATDKTSENTVFKADWRAAGGGRGWEYLKCSDGFFKNDETAWFYTLSPNKIHKKLQCKWWEYG